MEFEFLSKVLLYHKKRKWREILALNQAHGDLARKLTWVWPSEDNLQLIKNVLQQFGMSGVISIGCGCGLFEWLLQEYSGFPIIGYEVNEDWWSSRYSNPQFIKLNFPKLPPTSDIFKPNYALLFCYFNNGEAFKEYIDCYDGNFVFIIGPGPGSGRHTNPEPFCPDFGSQEWLLYKLQEVRDTKDFVGVYVRIKK